MHLLRKGYRLGLCSTVLNTTLCDKVCQWIATGPWFSPGTPVSSTNKTNCHDITEILLKVVLNTITLTCNPFVINACINDNMAQMCTCVLFNTQFVKSCKNFPIINTYTGIKWVCFIGGGNRSTGRKPWTCRNSLTNFIT
jgi:hypothetical protein